MEELVLGLGWMVVLLIMLLAFVTVVYRLYYAFERFKYLKTASAISAILEDKTFNDPDKLDELCRFIKTKKRIKSERD